MKISTKVGIGANENSSPEVDFVVVRSLSPSGLEKTSWVLSQAKITNRLKLSYNQSP